MSRMRAPQALVEREGWTRIEGYLSQLLAHVIATRAALWRSRPSIWIAAPL